MNFPSHIEDKIFEISYDSDNLVSKVVSYLRFSESERQEIISLINNDTFDGFRSVFTDTVSDEEWNKTKDQIKKKFRDELFDIDSM